MEVTSDLRCYIRHVRASYLCSHGSRTWCEMHGISWSAFLSDGIPAQALLDSGDPIVLRVVIEAQREEAGGA